MQNAEEIEALKINQSEKEAIPGERNNGLKTIDQLQKIFDSIPRQSELSFY